MANESSRTNEARERKQAFFYSGHDVNVAGLMNTLGIFYPHVPNYASAINLELHGDEKQQFYVKVRKTNLQISFRRTKYIYYIFPTGRP